MLLSVQVSDEVLSRAREGLQAIFDAAAGELQDSRSTKRTTYNFGYSYHGMKRGETGFTPIPDFLQDLCADAIEKLQAEGKVTLPEASEFTNCIVSIYGPGFRLQPHIDVDESKIVSSDKETSFFYGDDVIGVVIEADPTGRLYIIKADGKDRPVYDARKAMHVKERAGTAFLLAGEPRAYPYYHGVNEVAKYRLSVTYRTVEFR